MLFVYSAAVKVALLSHIEKRDERSKLGLFAFFGHFLKLKNAGADNCAKINFRHQKMVNYLAGEPHSSPLILFFPFPILKR